MHGYNIGCIPRSSVYNILCRLWQTTNGDTTNIIIVYYRSCGGISFSSRSSCVHRKVFFGMYSLEDAWIDAEGSATLSLQN